ncbi:MAG: hypothetical protein QW228_01180 [Candidatus Aenigmatarchaeota archaeon]
MSPIPPICEQLRFLNLKQQLDAMIKTLAKFSLKGLLTFPKIAASYAILFLRTQIEKFLAPIEQLMGSLMAAGAAFATDYIAMAMKLLKPGYSPATMFALMTAFTIEDQKLIERTEIFRNNVYRLAATVDKLLIFFVRIFPRIDPYRELFVYELLQRAVDNLQLAINEFDKAKTLTQYQFGVSYKETARSYLLLALQEIYKFSPELMQEFMYFPGYPSESLDKKAKEISNKLKNRYKLFIEECKKRIKNLPKFSEEEISQDFASAMDIARELGSLQAKSIEYGFRISVSLVTLTALYDLFVRMEDRWMQILVKSTSKVEKAECVTAKKLIESVLPAGNIFAGKVKEAGVLMGALMSSGQYFINKGAGFAVISALLTLTASAGIANSIAFDQYVMEIFSPKSFADSLDRISSMLAGIVNGILNALASVFESTPKPYQIIQDLSLAYTQLLDAAKEIDYYIERMYLLIAIKNEYLRDFSTITNYTGRFTDLINIMKAAGMAMAALALSFQIGNCILNAEKEAERSRKADERARNLLQKYKFSLLKENSTSRPAYTEIFNKELESLVSSR